MNITSWLADKVYRPKITGVNNSGEPEFGSNEIIPCRFESKVEITDTEDQREYVSKNQFCTTIKVEVGDDIWVNQNDLSDNDKLKTIKKVDYANNKKGNFTLYKAYL